MFSQLKRNVRAIYSSISIVSLLFQTFLPGLFVLIPNKVLAAEEKNIGTVNLDFSSESNEFLLSIESTSDVEYELTYSNSSSEVMHGVHGVASASDGNAFAREYAGTCSTNNICTPDLVEKGTINIPNANFTAEFKVINDVLWLFSDNQASVAKVELGKKYSAPQNSEVTVTFTSLPENPGSLRISEVILTEEQQRSLGAYSSIAYDITSSMSDGSFTYDLQLPLPEGPDSQLQVKYAENVSELPNAKEVVNEVITDDSVEVTGLDHFTVFVVVYNSFPEIMPGSYPSLGFQATATSEFGDHILLAGTERNAERITVELTNWACENDYALNESGQWVQNRANNEACVTTPGSSYTHPITINVYQVDNSGTIPQAGALVLSKTVDATIPFRPSYDEACTAPESDQPFGGTWYDSVSASCVHGYNFDVIFDLDGQVLPDQAIVAVAFNTQSYGYAPIGAAGPYNSLNMSVGPVSSTVGTNVNLDDVFWNTSHAPFYTDGGVAGVGILRQDTNWSGYVPVITIETSVPDTTGPEAPTIVYPNEGQYFNTTPILNDWTDVSDESGIDHYRIQYEYDDHHTFSGYPYRETTVSQRNHVPGINEQGGVSFRVQAFDTAGNEGEWSDWRHYYYDATAPEKPVLTSPSNGALVTGNPTQTWSPVSGVHHYVYASYSDSALTSQIYTTNLHGTSRTVGGNQTITFWWRVKAVDAAGNESPWSDAWQLNIDNTAPPVPNLVSPVNNAIVNGALLKNDWTDAADAHHYIYESYHDAGATNLRWHQETSVSEKSASNVANTTFWWRVKAADAAGNLSSWSELWKVTVDNDVPTTVLTAPTDSDAANDSFLISGTSSDTNQVLEVNLYYSVSGENNWHHITKLENSSHTQPFEFSYVWTPSSEGTYDIKASGTDLAGNVENSAYVYGLAFDTTAPDVEITSPSSSFVNGTIAVRGSVEDNNPHHYWFVIQNSSGSTVAGPGVVNDSNSFTDKLLLNWDTSVVPDGEYTIKLEARDSADNKDEGSVHWLSVTVDNTKPESLITTFGLDDGEQTETTTFDGLIEGTATDGEGSGIDHVLLSISRLDFGAEESERKYWDATASAWGTSYSLFSAVGTTDWTYQIPEESVLEGIYTIVSHAVDVMGHVEETYTIYVVYDKTIPEVVLAVTPALPDGNNGWYISQPSVTLTASDNYSIDHIEYQWNSTSGTWSTYSVAIVPPGEGQNILYYRSVDTVGNTSSLGVKEVKYDKTAPTDGPLNVRVDDIKSTTATGKWDKPSGDIEVHEYILSWKHKESGKEYSTSVDSNTFKYELTNLFDGLWEFRVFAVDAAGHKKDRSVDFRVGSEPTNGAVLGVTNDSNAVGGLLLGNSSRNNVDTTDEMTEDTSDTKVDSVASNVADQTNGSVLGKTDSTCVTWKFYLPLFLLFIQILLAVSLEIANREPTAKKIIYALVVSGLVIASFYIFRQPDCYSENSGSMRIFSQWFALISIATAFILRWVGSATVEEK